MNTVSAVKSTFNSLKQKHKFLLAKPYTLAEVLNYRPFSADNYYDTYNPIPNKFMLTLATARSLGYLLSWSSLPKIITNTRILLPKSTVISAKSYSDVKLDIYTNWLDSTGEICYRIGDSIQLEFEDYGTDWWLYSGEV